MKRLTAMTAIAFALASYTALAEARQPYAGFQDRPIKDLSDQEVSDLRAGRGMGLALAAELNGYPGPSHVLDLADKLDLTEQQRASIKQLFDSMKSEAVPLGQKLIAAAKDLDRRFAERAITPDQLKAAIAAIAQIRGELQYTHLKYHLSAAALLNPTQISRYAELRGYSTAAAAPNAHSGPASHRPGAMSAPMHQHMMGPNSQ